MEFSLQKIRKYLSLEDLSLDTITNTLNALGFEIDDIFEIDSKDDFKLTLKIPADRNDLLIESFFLEEISTLLKIENLFSWNKMKKYYVSILQSEYQLFYNKFQHKTNQSFEFLYSLQIEFTRHQIDELKLIQTPTWIKKKLSIHGIPSENCINDLINLISIEWGHKFLFSIENQQIRFFFPLNKKKKKMAKGAFLETYKFALQRFLTLLEIIFDGKIVNNIEYSVDNTVFEKQVEIKKIIRLRKSFLLNFFDFNENIFLKFQQAGVKLICSTKKEFYFQIKSTRKDLNREIDLVEEYCKFFGYQNFEEILPVKRVATNQTPRLDASKQFFISYGFNELFSSPLIEKAESFTSSRLSLTNPLTKDFSELREHLVDRLIEKAKLQYRMGYDFQNIFEIGRCFSRNEQRIIEIEKLGGLFQLKREKKDKNGEIIEWFQAKSFLENFLQTYLNEDFQYDSCDTKKINWLHPSRSVLITDSLTKEKGFFGEINPKFAKEINSKYKIYLFQINLNEKTKKTGTEQRKIFQDFSRLPIITKDFSFGTSINADFYLLKKNLKTSYEMIKFIELFDIYIPNDYVEKRRVNFGIRFHFQESTNEKLNQISNEFVNSIL